MPWNREAHRRRNIPLRQGIETGPLLRFLKEIDACHLRTDIPTAEQTEVRHKVQQCQ